MSRWFRHYAGMMRDEKLVRVALRSKQAVERVCWIWGAILESAAEIDDHGRFELDEAEAAYFLRADEDDIRSIMRGLEDLGRTNSGYVAKWGDRQFQSDRSADRVRAHRDRKRSVLPHRSHEETSRNDDVTLQDCSRNAPETETEEEKKEEHPVSPSEIRPPQNARGTFLPKDWVPTEDGFDRAMAELRNRDAVARELEKFRNFWFAKSGADGRKRDWEATWRNWIMRAADDGKRNGNRNGGRAAAADAYLAAANELLGELGHGGRGQAGVPAGPDAHFRGSRRHQLEDRRDPVGIVPGGF